VTREELSLAILIFVVEMLFELLWVVVSCCELLFKILLIQVPIVVVISIVVSCMLCGLSCCSKDVDIDGKKERESPKKGEILYTSLHPNELRLGHTNCGHQR